MKSARIALIMPKFARYSGAEVFGYRLAQALAEAGHAVEFICARAYDEPPEGVRTVEVGRFGPFKWLKVLWFALMAERARRRGKYDLSIGLGKVLRQDVFRVGGGPLPVFWRLSARAWPAGFPRFFKMLRRKLSPSNHIGWWIERVQARTTPVIVANSHLSKKWVLDAHPDLDPDAIRVIFNPPDLTRFSPPTEQERDRLREKAGIQPGQVALLTAGTNFALKGVGTLLRTMALLPERYILRIAGGRGAGRWLQLAKTLGVGDRVRFLGKVEDMAGFYGSGDMFVLPTFYDASSNAVMEALASGLKVVSGATNGSAHFLPREQILADSGDCEGLASMLLELESAPRPGPFSWPEDMPSGMDAWVELVDHLLTSSQA